MSSYAVRAKAAAESGSPRVGRPARVNAQTIVAAAIEIGLERVTLKRVADRLGVAVATLYRYVSSSKELVSLAAMQVALARKLPERGNVHWSELATHYAEVMYESFVSEPQLVSELVKGNLGPDLEIEILEQFLAALSEQGFSAAEGVHLHRAVGILAIGAAVGVIASRASDQMGMPRNLSMRRALAERSDDELPLVRSALPEYLNLAETQWRPVLDALLQGIAAARGERLPVRSPPSKNKTRNKSEKATIRSRQLTKQPKGEENRI